MPNSYQCSGVPVICRLLFVDYLLRITYDNSVMPVIVVGA